MKFFINYTTDRIAYYISTNNYSKFRPKNFLSVDKIYVPHTKAMEQSSIFEPTFIEIKKKDEVYCRKVWNFIFFNMNVGLKVPVDFKLYDTHKDLVIDYAWANNWKIDFRNIFEKIRDTIKKK